MLLKKSKSFLSHLCGGERKVNIRHNYASFLSHLCGGEP
ncbi:hypothetical protein BSPWISOX_1649 [uncultured Gammaproteobacteria bacterium]|nr:hypothetical protein BSPWISOX_1649 [uncultured Gammaproteobacteria bacterium]